MLTAWYSDRPEVLAWQQQTIAHAKRHGHTRTLMGRYRSLPGIQGGRPAVRGHMERAAINTPIQGGAADIMTLAMLKLDRSELLREMGFKMLLQVADSSPPSTNDPPKNESPPLINPQESPPTHHPPTHHPPRITPPLITSPRITPPRITPQLGARRGHVRGARGSRGEGEGGGGCMHGETFR